MIPAPSEKSSEEGSDESAARISLPREVQVVRHMVRGKMPQPMQVLEETHDHLTGSEVEAAGRLVGEQGAGIAHQRARGPPAVATRPTIRPRGATRDFVIRLHPTSPSIRAPRLLCCPPDLLGHRSGGSGRFPALPSVRSASSLFIHSPPFAAAVLAGLAAGTFLRCWLSEPGPSALAVRSCGAWAPSGKGRAPSQRTRIFLSSGS